MHSQGIFTLTLSSIRVDGSRGHSQVEQVVVDEVGSLLGANKDEGTRWRHGDQQVVESSHLLVLIHPQDLQRVSQRFKDIY